MNKGKLLVVFHVVAFDNAHDVRLGQPSKVLGPFESREHANSVARNIGAAKVIATPVVDAEKPHSSVEEKLLREVCRANFLDSIIFIMDYLQFTFNGAVLSMFVSPKIRIGDEFLDQNSLGWRDRLCDLITHFAIDVTIEQGDKITMLFDTGVYIEISLRPTDRNGPEAVMFRTDASNDKRWWVF